MSDLVAYARDLEAEDETLAAAIAEVESLRAGAAELRARAAHAVRFLAGLPAAREAGDAALADARGELERRAAEARDADAELARAEKEEAVLAARRAVVRTRDLVHGAELKVERLAAERDALEGEARAVEAELPELDRRAGELAAALEHVSRAPDAGAPDAGPAAVEAWAARAEAALFVARSGLETERDRVVRQANELAASALGEPFASSVAAVRERLERLD